MRREIWEKRAEPVRRCLDRGMTDLEIIAHLSLSPATVAVYRRRILGDGFRPDKREMQIRECAARGLTRDETAKELGLNVGTVGRRARQGAIEFRVPLENYGYDPERAEVMAAMYSAGRTLQEIGDIYGISRERVRQVIKKRHGLDGKDGGKSFIAKRNAETRKARRDAKYIKRYGCTYAQYLDLKRIGEEMQAAGRGAYQRPIAAYRNQENNARIRGIAWELSLFDWWSVWQKSGKWEQRGRGRGYMMCRFGDTGPYAVGNVYIATGVHNGTVQPNNPYRNDHPDHEKVVGRWKQNIALAHREREFDGHRVHIGLPKGVTARGGRYVAQTSIDGRNRYLGMFSTPDEAHQAYLAARQAA